MSKASVIEHLKGEIAALESGGNESSRLEQNPKRDKEERTDAFAKIVALVNVSDRSEKTLRERLARAEFPEAEIEDAVERAKRCGIIDDLRFANILIHSRLSQGRGAAGIERELRDNGISVDEVPGWPYDYAIDEESERQRALAFLDAHPTRSKNVRDGAYRKLIQRGYSVPIASAVARMWSETRK